MILPVFLVVVGSKSLRDALDPSGWELPVPLDAFMALDRRDGGGYVVHVLSLCV